MRISDWSSDVCSSDLCALPREQPVPGGVILRRVMGPVLRNGPIGRSTFGRQRLFFHLLLHVRDIAFSHEKIERGRRFPASDRSPLGLLVRSVTLTSPVPLFCRRSTVLSAAGNYNV